MKTKTLLPYARVVTYDLPKNVDRGFANVDQARDWLSRSNTRVFNLYRIDRVNGTWRTDWELE